MGYKEDNARKIEDAFARFRANAEAEFRNGLEAVLDAGVEFCLQEHYENPPFEELRAPWNPHHVEDGGYGWILIHNGVEVSRKLWGDNPVFVNEANDQLNTIKGKASSEGWVGIIMASLREERYFNVMYEFIPMRAAIRDLKTEDFNRYFKPMAV